MCHCLAAIAMQLPVLGDGMLGDLVELYKVIGRSATDKQQELLVNSYFSNLLWMNGFQSREDYHRRLGVRSGVTWLLGRQG